MYMYIYIYIYIEFKGLTFRLASEVSQEEAGFEASEKALTRSRSRLLLKGMMELPNRIRSVARRGRLRRRKTTRRSRLFARKAEEQKVLAARKPLSICFAAKPELSTSVCALAS